MSNVDQEYLLLAGRLKELDLLLELVERQDVDASEAQVAAVERDKPTQQRYQLDTSDADVLIEAPLEVQSRTRNSPSCLEGSILVKEEGTQTGGRAAAEEIESKIAKEATNLRKTLETLNSMNSGDEASFPRSDSRRTPKSKGFYFKAFDSKIGGIDSAIERWRVCLREGEDYVNAESSADHQKFRDQSRPRRLHSSSFSTSSTLKRRLDHYNEILVGCDKVLGGLKSIGPPQAEPPPSLPKQQSFKKSASPSLQDNKMQPPPQKKIPKFEPFPESLDPKLEFSEENNSKSPKMRAESSEDDSPSERKKVQPTQNPALRPNPSARIAPFMRCKPADIKFCGVSAAKINQTRVNLNVDVLRLLHLYINERHNIFKRKELLKIDPPYTSDKILGSYRFTNVRRELDRQTRLLIGRVVNNGNLTYEDKLINIVLFRLVNRAETLFDLLGGPFSDFGKLDLEVFRKRVEDVQRRKDVALFTSAYNTAGARCEYWAKPPGYPHFSFFENNHFMRVLRCVHCFANDQKLLKSIKSSETQKDVVKALMSWNGIGRFMAYQMFVDFSYIPEFPFSENEFTVSGPGCQRGLAYLVQERKKLRDNLGSAWESVGLSFDPKKLFDHLPVHDQCLNVMMMENAMCELSKLVRAKRGIGRPKNGYHTHGPLFLSASDCLLADSKFTLPRIEKADLVIVTTAASDAVVPPKSVPSREPPLPKSLKKRKSKSQGGKKAKKEAKDEKQLVKEETSESTLTDAV